LLAVIFEVMGKDNTDVGVAHANGILECLVSHGILESNEDSGRFRVTVTYRGDIAAKKY
jgi:predicted transcriptional regulator